jgi:septal ring factor EnvC (AmiA/AmiB activator)
MICLCATVAFAQETDGQAEREQLETIQQQLKEKQSTLDRITGKERTLLGELRAIEEQLQAARQQLEAYQQQLADNEAKLQQTQAKISKLKAKSAEHTAMLTNRLRAIYKMGDLGYLAPLLSLSSQSSTQQQLLYLQRLAASDKQLLKESEAHIQAIVKEQKILEQRKQELVESQKKVEQQSREILAQQQQKATLLSNIQTDKEQNLQFMQELQQSAIQLDALIQDFEPTSSLPEATSKPGPNVTIPSDAETIAQSYARRFRSNKGRLLWPVQGQVFTGFGKIRIGDTFTQYKGVDIRAAAGAPFYAVFKGVIKYADWFDGYGNLIIVDHGGDFFTLYAHASEILVQSGDIVESRQLLGKVGDTDSIKGPHLYFEIRANGKPENPQAWLAKVQ